MLDGRGIRKAALASAGLAAAAIGALLVMSAPATAAVGPGCSAKRHAVPHHAGGRVLRLPPTKAPIPCLTTAGKTTDSAPVAVTPSGTVLYAPIATASPGEVQAPADVSYPTRVARTLDDGAHWSSVLPVEDPSDDTHRHIGLIPWLYSDPETGRVWYATPAPALCGAMISWSDDEGRTWTDNDMVGCPGQGGMSVFEGPAPRGAPRPVGYPHVVYYCANLQDNGPHLMYCYRSLDGGRSFAQVGGFPNSPNPPPSCQDSLDAPRGRAVAPNGTVFFVVDRCDEGLGLAKSRDEGDSWRRRPITPTPTENMPITSLAIDARGNLYVAYTRASNDLPYLTVSRTRGRTWSRPAMVAAPHVNKIDPRTLAITADRGGHVALAYSGSRDDGGTYSAYMAESKDALRARPVWWSSAVNNPKHPLAIGKPSSLYGDRDWFGTVVFGPDETPWAGFHCVRVPACPDDRFGVVGHLARPAR